MPSPPCFPDCSQADNSVSEKNSSRKLAEQARLPTLRYHIGIRVYAGEFGEEPLSQVR
jgi:hypothetical protein